VEPALALPDCKFVVHGVRYPDAGRKTLEQAGIEFRGYIPNLTTPLVYAQSALALHIPRRQYANGLSGIPTIRVFEVLACGATLVCAPWSDAEDLFRSGIDYALVADQDEMIGEIEHLLKDEAARKQIAQSGLETIRKRHTCAHRATQLTEICEELGR